jgi:hypothetical protein
MSISGEVMSGAPWGAAAVTGGAVAVAELSLHVISGSIGLAALSASASAGAAVLIAVAAAGAVWRAGSGRTARWVRSNPWRFAILPGLAAAAIALVLTVVTGGGIFDSVLSALWHGGAVYGVSGAAGMIAKTRKQTV